MSDRDLRVGIVEDDDEIRESLKLILNASPGYTCDLLFDSAEAALEVLAQEKPDVVLMDISLPGISGIECVRLLKERMR